MNVQELRDLLSTLPDDMPVIISSDEEGNSFNPLSGVDISDSCFVKIGNEYNVGLRALTPELKRQGYGEDDVYEDGTPCVVIWP